MSSEDSDGGRIGAFGYVRKHYTGLQLWRKLLLVVSITAVAAGSVGIGLGKVDKPPEVPAAAPVVAPAPVVTPPSNQTLPNAPQKIENLPGAPGSPTDPNAKNFSTQDVKAAGAKLQAQANLEAQKAQAAAQAETQVAIQKARWYYDQFSPNLLQIGISFFVAFLLGYAFRQFIKTMATMAAIVVVGAVVVQLAGWADVAGIIKGHTTQAKDLGGQAYEFVKAMAIDKLPMSATGVIGFLVGFLRSK